MGLTNAELMIFPPVSCFFLFRQDDGKQHLSLAITALVEAPIFVVCALTGLGLLVFAVQLLRRLRRLRLMLRNEQVLAALRAGVQGETAPTFQSSEGSTEEAFASQRSLSTVEAGQVVPSTFSSSALRESFHGIGGASVNETEIEKDSDVPAVQAMDILNFDTWRVAWQDAAGMIG
eukprot:symbB.v1.2.013724.t1/scaffold977.1/size148281/7